MSGEQLIPASREAVWAALNDPEILKQSIAGCTELNKKSDTEFDAKVTAKVGPVKANFAGNVKLSKLKPPVSYVISGQGKGGAAGFAKGGATVNLEEQDGQTLLRYDVDAQVGGKLAQIGSRLIQSTARKMADDFFKQFAKLV
ncbi:MAG: SRPBCC family protein, partial [Aestuariivirgaceae bacterium]